jgi:dUTP pyrophosphatase
MKVFDKYNSLKIMVAENTMKVRVKRIHEDAVIPKYANVGDAGMDLTAISKELDDMGNVVYRTGLAYEIPDGFVGLIFPRSSVSKLPMSLANSVGVIDSGYRGEIMFKFKPTAYYNDEVSIDTFTSMDNITYNVGDRIGQMIIIPYPQIEIEETDSFTESSRGENGFGSTGN